MSQATTGQLKQLGFAVDAVLRVARSFKQLSEKKLEGEELSFSYAGVDFIMREAGSPIVQCDVMASITALGDAHVVTVRCVRHPHRDPRHVFEVLARDMRPQSRAQVTLHVEKPHFEVPAPTVDGEGAEDL